MNSVRKSSERSAPVKRKLLPNATFQLAVPSFRNVFQPRLPRPPGEILLSKYLQCKYGRPSVPGGLQVFAPSSGPTVSGLSKLFPSSDGFKILGRCPVLPSPLPEPGASDPVWKWNVPPDWKRAGRESCHPFSQAAGHLIEPAKKGRR